MQEIEFTVDYVNFLTESMFELELFTTNADKLPPMRAGQFIHVKIPTPPFLLRRPFCIYKFDAKEHYITLVIAIVGKGTESLSRLVAGDRLMGILPLGNGFTLADNHQKIALVGGGIGCAPLLRVPLDYPGREFRSYLGFADKSQVMFADDFIKVSKVTVSTDDGSYGFKGYVTDAFLQDVKKGFRPDVILTCGPEPMIRAVAKIAQEAGIPAYMSGEVRMGCGVGACLVCACAVREGGEVRNKRACVDGPVFALGDLVL